MVYVIITILVTTAKGTAKVTLQEMANHHKLAHKEPNTIPKIFLDIN